MNNEPVMLLRRRWPMPDEATWVPDELVVLPHRVLFQNEFVGVILVGLTQGYELLFDKPSHLLVTVTHGQARVAFQGRRKTLREGSQHRVEMGAGCALRALLETDLLFFIPTDRAINF